MRVKTKNGQSIVSQLTDIINHALPRTIDTGIGSHLGNNIKADSKGKSILFTWKKNLYGFRMTENLKVMEMDFTGTFTQTEDSKAVEMAVEASLKPIAEIAPVKEEVKEEIPVIA